MLKKNTENFIGLLILVIPFIFLIHCSSTHNYGVCPSNCDNFKLKNEEILNYFDQIKNLKIAFVKVESHQSGSLKIPSSIENLITKGIKVDSYSLRKFSSPASEFDERLYQRVIKDKNMKAIESLNEIPRNQYDKIILYKTDFVFFELSDSFRDTIALITLGIVPLYFKDEGWLNSYLIINPQSNSQTEFKFEYHVFNRVGLFPWLYALFSPTTLIQRTEVGIEIIWVSKDDVSPAQIWENEVNIILVNLAEQKK